MTAWHFDWSIGTDWPIKMSSIHAIMLTCQRRKQMITTLVQLLSEFQISKEAKEDIIVFSRKLHNLATKVRNCYRVSIPSNQAAKNFFITSKSNNKITGNWDCLVLSNLAIYIKKAVLKLKNDFRGEIASKIQFRPT